MTSTGQQVCPPELSWSEQVLQESNLSATANPWTPNNAPQWTERTPEHTLPGTARDPAQSQTSPTGQQLLHVTASATPAFTSDSVSSSTSDGSSSDTDSDGTKNPEFTRDEILTAQAGDKAIRSILDYLQKGRPPDASEIRQLSGEARQMVLQWDSLILREDILYRRFQHADGSTKYFQLVLPGRMRKNYLEKLHADLGHFGKNKTCEAVTRRAYFPEWRHYTKLIVKNCSICNCSQRGKTMPKQTALRPMNEFRPMAVLHAALVGPIPEGTNGKGQRGFQYILSVVDSATKYLWLLPLRNKTADAVAGALYEDVIVRTSVPTAILTDRDGEFTAAVMERLS